MKFEHNWRLVAVSVVFFSLIATDAFALDAYKDRRGIFFGLGLGGGIGAVANPPGEVTGIQDGEMGLATQLTLGSGIWKSLTFGGQFNWWVRTVDVNDQSLVHHHLNFLATGSFFPLDFLYATAGFGMAYAIYDSSVGGFNVREYRELGIAARIGAGMEFWVNGQVATGIEAAYSRHFYSGSDFDTFTGGLVVKWY